MTPQQFEQFRAKLRSGATLNTGTSGGSRPTTEADLPAMIEATRATPKPSIFNRAGNVAKEFLSPTGSFATGAQKGVLGLVRGAASLGEKGLEQTLGRLPILPGGQPLTSQVDRQEPTGAEQLIPQSSVDPKGIGENLGYMAEKIAEFLLPSKQVATVEKAVGATIKGVKMLPGAIKGLASVGSRSAIEAGVVGGQTAVQQGTFSNDAKTAAIIGAAFPVVGSAYKAVKSSTLGNVGKKIQTAVIRPQAVDIKDGFQIENVNKYDLGGSVSDTLLKSQQKLNKLSSKLRTTLKGTDAGVDMVQAYKDTVQSLANNKTRLFGNIKKTMSILTDLREELDLSLKGYATQGGEQALPEYAGQLASGLNNVDLWTATQIKRGAGTKGAWVYGSGDPDASAIQKVYNTFYSKLKTAIEKAAPKEVADINKQISEIIPISHAALRRLPIEQRNNLLSLSDNMGLFSAIFDPKALALIGANKLAKSGKVGEFLVKLAEKEAKTPIGKRIMGVK